MNQPTDVPLEVSCAEVKQSQTAGGDFLLVDCREAEEYATAKIEGAELIPMSVIQERVTELEPHRNRRIVVHCHHGGRSLRVANWLRQQGYAGAQSMAGGIDRWSLEIDTKVPRY